MTPTMRSVVEAAGMLLICADIVWQARRRPRTPPAELAGTYDGARSERDIAAMHLQQLAAYLETAAGTKRLRRLRAKAELARIAEAFADAREDWRKAEAAAEAVGTPHRDDVVILYRARRKLRRNSEAERPSPG